MTWAKATHIATGEVHFDSTPEFLDPEVYTVEALDAEPIEPLREEKLRAVDARLAQAFGAGFVVPSGPLAGKVLQVRNEKDRTNWLTSKDIYGDEINAGHGDVEEAEFRTADNEMLTVTYSEGFAALQAMAAWARVLMKNSWALKDATKVASADGLDAIDLEAGWP
jgi:hypothetical protein